MKLDLFALRHLRAPRRRGRGRGRVLRPCRHVTILTGNDAGNFSAGGSAAVARLAGRGRVEHLGGGVDVVSGQDLRRLRAKAGRFARRPPSWFVGKFCKKAFPAPGGGEHMWVEALEVHGGEVCGVLNNEPIVVPGVHRGDPVCFRADEVEQVMSPAAAAKAAARAGGRARAKAAPRSPGERFRSLVAKLRARGADDPKALAAWIGRKKYGKQKFQAMAAAGQRHAARKARR